MARPGRTATSRTIDIHARSPRWPRFALAGFCLFAAAALFHARTAEAVIFDVSIDGSDAIFLAGRTDVTIPDASLPWTTGTHLIRYGGATPEEIQEKLPPEIAINAGDVVQVADPAVGGINFFNGFAPLISARAVTVRRAAI